MNPMDNYTLQIFIFKLGLAVALGMLIGFERQLKHKAAGIKTNVLICLGSALFTIISMEFGRVGQYDGSRIAAQIVSGIGFLGAGVIIQSRGSVVGLTTAATIFVVASIGMAVGRESYLYACAATLIILITLFGVGRIEHRFFATYQNFDYSIHCKDPVALFARVTEVLKAHNLAPEDISIQKDSAETLVTFTIHTTVTVHNQILPKVLKVAEA